MLKDVMYFKEDLLHALIDIEWVEGDDSAMAATQKIVNYIRNSEDDMDVILAAHAFLDSARMHSCNCTSSAEEIAANYLDRYYGYN